MMKMAAGEETLRASDGLALARCGGLLMSLSKPGLAAPGAGLGTNTTAAAEQCGRQSGALGGKIFLEDLPGPIFP
eukprot:SAG11_NODE_1358_length_5120_cov_1.838080_2_plen_75_part_00